MNPFCAKNLKTHYNKVPKVAHGTERVKLCTNLILQGAYRFCVISPLRFYGQSYEKQLKPNGMNGLPYVFL